MTFLETVASKVVMAGAITFAIADAPTELGTVTDIFGWLVKLVVAAGGFAGIRAWTNFKRDRVETAKVSAERDVLIANATKTMIEAAAADIRMKDSAMDRMKAEAEHHRAEADRAIATAERERALVDKYRVEADTQLKLADEASRHFIECEKELERLRKSSHDLRDKLHEQATRIAILENEIGLRPTVAKAPEKEALDG